MRFAAVHESRWHEADIKLRPLFGRYRVESGHHRLVMSISAFDPKQTSSNRLASRLNCHDTVRMGDHHAGGAGPGVNFNATPFMQ